MHQNTRLARAVAFAALALVVAGCEGQPVVAPAAGPVVMAIGSATSVPPPAAVREPAGQTPATAPVPAEISLSYPETGSGRWVFAPGDNQVAGSGGRLLQYRIAVETDITGIDPVEFAGEIRTTLADARGWTAGGDVRLQQVDPDGDADFTIYLATPASRDKLCGGRPDGYTSCRNGSNVVLNVARWAHAVPAYPAPLSVYRQYMVTHETGHRLGHGHELCPGAGKAAPVMEQQTLGLHGCVPNPWPFPGGAAYSGPTGEYDDPIPAGAS